MELCYVTHTAANVSTDIKRRADLSAIAGPPVKISCVRIGLCTKYSCICRFMRQVR